MTRALAMSTLDLRILDFKISYLTCRPRGTLKKSSNIFTLYLTNYGNVKSNMHNGEGKTTSLLGMSKSYTFLFISKDT